MAPLQGFFKKKIQPRHDGPPFYRGVIYITMSWRGEGGEETTTMGLEMHLCLEPRYVFLLWFHYYSTNIYLQLDYTVTTMTLAPMPTSTPMPSLPPSTTTTLSYHQTHNGLQRPWKRAQTMIKHCLGLGNFFRIDFVFWQRRAPSKWRFILFWLRDCHLACSTTERAQTMCYHHLSPKYLFFFFFFFFFISNYALFHFQVLFLMTTQYLPLLRGEGIFIWWWCPPLGPFHYVTIIVLYIHYFRCII